MLIARGTFIGSKFMHILSVLRCKWIYQTSIFNSPSSFLESDSKIKEPYIVCCGKEKPFAGSTLTCKLLQGYKTSVKNHLLDKQGLTHKPFNSQKWSTCRFSLKYPYIIQQTGSENTQTYQVQDIILMKHQFLITNLQGNVLQLKGRINNQILGVQGLISLTPLLNRFRRWTSPKSVQPQQSKGEVVE